MVSAISENLENNRPKKKGSCFSTLGNVVVQPYFAAAETHHSPGFKMNFKEMHFLIVFLVKSKNF